MVEYTRRDESPLQNTAQSSAEDCKTDLFVNSPFSVGQKLRTPSVYLTRQIHAQLICYQKLVEMTQGIAGNIVECGVFRGMGLMAYANILSALEPYNYPCKVLGFDTFEGDIGASEIDHSPRAVVSRKKFTYTSDSYEHIKAAINVFDMDRPLSHLQKVEVFKGDICSTGEDYLCHNPQHLTRILHLSMNLYTPTLSALKSFYPSISQGGIIVVHGLNFTTGATAALKEYLESLSRLSIKTFDFCPNFTYFVKGKV